MDVFLSVDRKQPGGFQSPTKKKKVKNENDLPPTVSLKKSSNDDVPRAFQRSMHRLKFLEEKEKERLKKTSASSTTTTIDNDAKRKKNNASKKNKGEGRCGSEGGDGGGECVHRASSSPPR